MKALVYLQDGASLRVIPGSHLHPIDLSSDAHVVPQDDAKIEDVSAAAGDIILMDIRLVHRGATDEQMEEKTLDSDAKILISTVFGEKYAPLAQSMQVGNMRRLVDWENRNPSALTKEYLLSIFERWEIT